MAKDWLDEALIVEQKLRYANRDTAERQTLATLLVASELRAIRRTIKSAVFGNLESQGASAFPAWISKVAEILRNYEVTEAGAEDLIHQLMGPMKEAKQFEAKNGVKKK